jgi:alpha-beta hydrolase superfamily lysophospholipase
MTPLVVLLHGLARGPRSMARLAAHLAGRGFDTWSQPYPSRSEPLTAIAPAVANAIARAAAGRPVSAVTHSMGGIVARHLHDPRIAWQRIVMLAPPNQGSRIARDLAANPMFRWFYGPAGRDLADSRGWPAPPAPFAVIAGTRARALTNPTSWTAGRRFPPGTANDGTVAVAETRLDGMADFAEVDATHTWIMNDARVHDLVVRYLRDGRF